ncbi:hypothetical protein Q1695_013111 [Nippostrongylus brasiliensis]|nr:hypothetical protein Q1695_013111 [Nippostrongylus brasiliensis]
MGPFIPNFIQPHFHEVLIHPALRIRFNNNLRRKIFLWDQLLPEDDHRPQFFSSGSDGEDNGEVGFFVAGRINLHGVCSSLVHGSSINDVEGNGNFVDITDIVRRDVKGLILHELPEVGAFIHVVDR